MLRDQVFLIIDCQTTGMRPSVGSLLEIAWGFADTRTTSFEIQSSLIKLADDESIPARVKEITGIKASDLEFARSLESVRAQFKASLEKFIAQSDSCSAGAKPIALIHYAQFEEAWLKDFLGVEELPFELLCTHRIAKKLFPQVPSRNIRGLTGFFGMRIGEIKRAAQHVLGTQLIWTGIVDALEKSSLTTIDDLRAFLAEKPKKKSRADESVPKISYEYRVEREKRLKLPAKPGVYKMLAKDGEILYVGKATSLKDRVNSYFRGKKGRDPRKLELMAQVWDFETIECESAIEAALIESDEIKRLNPPYNVSLKEGGRGLLYYDRSLESESLIQSKEYPIGPFRRFNSLEHLRVFARGLREDVIHNVFYQPIESDVLEGGYAIFAEKFSGTFRPDEFTTRDHLAFALWLSRQEDEESVPEEIGSDELETEPSLEEAALTAEDVAEKIEHLYLHAAQTYLRTKKLTDLLWADISWQEKGETKKLAIRAGKIINGADRDNGGASVAPWRDLSIADYDRMSVLLTEISKVPNVISRR